jgi:hypothetical protein
LIVSKKLIYLFTFDIYNQSHLFGEKIDGFKASQGWMENFKHRHSIVFKKNQGESAEINIDSLNNWQKDVFQAEINRFDQNNVVVF